MTYRNPHYLLALSFLLVLAIGCKSSQHSILPEPVPDPQQIGVFASTDRGLLELTAYGKQTSMQGFMRPSLSTVPRVARVTSLYINMPGSTITESKVFWLAKLDHESFIEPDPPLNTSVEVEKNNGYRITCADLEGKKGGYVLLKISMPLGTPDRMYAIQLAE